ncbi:hypothetical protein CAEBREN_18283 [Caenorhabditis brenneri]|uniref:C-type lectin domain-containing protein n=1 Tax=Caenorhabditis brenneri TaxID=135651 RepID=G0MKF5_CAEBE|nr:hypothetical protein CAEBREN_18283 [Caenorhabditis brenneri]
MMNFNQFFIFSLLPLVINAQCDPGAIYSPERNKCYQYHTIDEDFKTAESICENSNGHLISVHTAIDNTYFAQQAQKNLYNGLVWLGANADSPVLSNPDNWKWMDKTPFNYQNYQSGQPSVLGSSACMVFNASTGKWLTPSCQNSYPFICASDPVNTVQTTCAPQKANKCPSRYAWLEETNACYKLVSSKKNFTEANAACKQEGAELASIHSKLENDFLVEMSTTSANSSIPSGHSFVYIGLVYLQNKWQWTDGSESEHYRNWAVGEPNYLNREFWTVLMPDPCRADYNPTGTQWNNIENMEQRAFICKKPAN